MNKKKILMIFLIVMLVIFFLLGCYAIYKFVIIHKIFNRMKEYVAIENYYMKITDMEDESETIEVYFKDGIGKMVMPNGVYTWTDGEEAYLVDDVNKQIQSASWDSSILISNEYVGSMVPGYSKSTFEKFLLAGDLNTSIKVKNYSGIKYYMITTDEGQKRTSWFQCETLLPSQVDMEIGEFSKSYNYEIVFEKLTDADVERPNVEEYTFVEEQ